MATKEVQDLLSVVGFLAALQRCLRLRESGLQFLGIPCCSFSWMSSSVHKRTPATPFGDRTRRFVAAGNVLTSRSCILVLVGLVRKVHFFIEQPAGSAMSFFPYVCWLLKLNQLGALVPDIHLTRWFLGMMILKASYYD